MTAGNPDFIDGSKQFVQKFLKPTSDELHVTVAAGISNALGGFGVQTINLTEGEGKYRQLLNLGIRGYSGNIPAAVEFQVSTDNGANWSMVNFVAIDKLNADNLDITRGIILLESWKIRIQLINEDVGANQFYYSVSYLWQD